MTAVEAPLFLSVDEVVLIDQHLDCLSVLRIGKRGRKGEAQWRTSNRQHGNVYG